MTSSAPVRDLDALARALAQHPVYGAVRDARALRTFVEHHAVCVLDFMTLLKRLQEELAGTLTPWVPTADATAARLVNEIVLGEESDAELGPEPISHYAFYLEAMEELGADTAPIRSLEANLRAGVAPPDALELSGLPDAAIAFSRTTFELAAGPPHVVAAAFVRGREDVIPEMFLPLLAELRASGAPCTRLQRYLERHVEVDTGEHGPAARRLLDRLVGDDAARGTEATEAAHRALLARRRLWDAAALACGQGSA